MFVLVVAILGVLVLAAAAQEYDVSGTLTNCVVAEIDSGFVETCDLESPDEMFGGTWTFAFAIEESSDGEISIDDKDLSGTFDPNDVEQQFGEMTLVTPAGSWEGAGVRVLSSSGTLEEFWASMFVGDRVRDAADGGSWLIGGIFGGEGELGGLELQIGGAGDEPGPPYAIKGWIEPEDTSLSRQQIVSQGIVVVVLAGLAAPVIVAALKGRWWMGVLGFVALVGGIMVVLTLNTEPAPEFLEGTLGTSLAILLSLAVPAGLLLLLLGAVRPARPGSWWDRHRSKVPDIAE